jgi:uncharacterized damage-inducible protein DinB
MITQTPWFERKFDFNFPIGLFPIILERLRGTVWQLEAIIKNISEEQLNTKIEGKWSVKEVIGHLYDLEELWSGRIDDFLSHKDILRAADLGNTKTHEAGHNLRSVKTLLNQFATERKKLIERVQNIDSATASIVALHPRLQTPMRLIDSLFFVAEHDDHELGKIRRLIDNIEN